MSIEIDINKFPEYPEIQNLLNRILQDNNRLTKRVEDLEHILSDILLLNSLGKTLKINEVIHAAVDILE
jgi:hypothetical protein